MPLVDSAAAFNAHCEVIDPGGPFKNLLQSSLLELLSRQFLTKRLGSLQPMSMVELICRWLSLQLAQLRRLRFEAQTLVVAHLKSQVSIESTEGVRKLPAAE